VQTKANPQKLRKPPATAMVPEESQGSLQPLVVRACAVASLALLAALGLSVVRELRGELAFARLLRLRQLVTDAEASGDGTRVLRAVQNSSAEAELVMLFARGNADALRTTAAACRTWSASKHLDPLLRLRLGEKAVTAAALAVRAAPSDYEPWLQLSRALASIGLWEQAQACLQRAQDLAPVGKLLRANALDSV